MHENTLTYMLVTPVKTLLFYTQILSPMETIRTIIYNVLYVGITSFLIISLLATIISYIRQLRDWALGEGEEGEETPMR